MNPRTHPRGARPDFTLPRPNPNPSRMTDALWWLVCMREALEPTLSENGGTFADKPGYHNIGNSLPNHGEGDARTDHSIRRAPDRSGSWWRTKASAHDWTFRDAQRGDYRTIQKYTKRLINAMRDPDDLRPDSVYAYTLGQTDGDAVVEGYNEYRDEAETSGDDTHLWHRHDSFRRNIIGDFWAMWKALTIDMGWTYAEWQRSVAANEESDMPLTNDDADVILNRDVIPNPYGDAETNPTISVKTALKSAANADVRVTQLAATVALLRAELAAVKAAVAADDLDESALAGQLAPAVAAAVIAALPQGADQISQDEVNAAVVAAFRGAFAS